MKNLYSRDSVMKNLYWVVANRMTVVPKNVETFWKEILMKKKDFVEFLLTTKLIDSDKQRGTAFQETHFLGIRWCLGSVVHHLVYYEMFQYFWKQRPAASTK